MKRKSPRKRKLRFAFTLFGLILLILALIVLFQPAPRSVKEADGSYSVSSNLNLEDRIKNNLLYPNDTSLDDPSLIYTNVTSALLVNITLYYYNSIGNASTVHNAYQVFLVSINPGWRKETFSSASNITLTSGSFYTELINLNLSSNLSLGREINRQLGYSYSQSYSIEITDVAASRFGTSYSNLTVAAGNLIDTLKGPTNHPVSGIFTNTVIISGERLIPIERTYAYIMGFVGAALIGFLVLTTESKSSDYVMKFRRENSDYLIELNSGPPDGAVMIIRTDDLIKMALLTESPVYIHGNIVFMELDGKSYYSEIKEKKLN